MDVVVIYDMIPKRPRLTCVSMSETTPEDHLIIFCEFLMANKVHAMTSSI